MAKCDFCGKGVTFGIKVSHSHRRSNKAWKPNVKRVKAIVDGTPRHVYVCTRSLILQDSHKSTAFRRGFFSAFFSVPLPHFQVSLCIPAHHIYNPLYIVHKTLPTEPALLGRSSIENTQMTRYNRIV